MAWRLLTALAACLALAACGAAASGRNGTPGLRGVCYLNGPGTFVMSLINPGTASVEVGGFDAAFYDSHGFQVGEDKVIFNNDAGQPGPQWVTPGRPLVLTETPADYTPIAGGMSGQLGSRCSLKAWYLP